MVTRQELLTREVAAHAYLDKKGIRTACHHYLKAFGTGPNGEMTNLNKQEMNEPNILYVGTKKSCITTPVNDGRPGSLERLTQARLTGQILAEIPFAGMDGYSNALIEAAAIVQAKLGTVTLSDVVEIPYADKSEIKKLITRMKKSKTEAELKARGEELENLINQYEERQNDTENEDLQEKFQGTVEALENGQQELENGDKESAISEIEEALYL